MMVNVFPHGNQRVCNQHRTQGVRMWSTLLSSIPENTGQVVERASLKWPARRRLNHLYDTLNLDFVQLLPALLLHPIKDAGFGIQRGQTA
jgi:hypothetical protein